MDKFVISLIPIILYLILKMKKSLHMLQQSYYNDGDRYLKWIWNNINKTFIQLDLLFVSFWFVDFLDTNIIILFAGLLYLFLTINYYITLKKEQSKLPLAFTKRIRRLCVTILILFTIPIIGIFKNFDVGYIN